MGYVEVSATTSPRRAAEIRARLLNPPNAYIAPATTKSVEPTPEQGLKCTLTKWGDVPAIEKARIFRKHYVKGDTYGSIAKRVSRETGLSVTRAAFSGFYRRHRGTLLANMAFSDIEHRPQSPAKRDNLTADDYAKRIRIVRPRIKGGVSIADLVKLACEVYMLSEDGLRLHVRFRSIIFKRHKIMWVATKLSGQFPEVVGDYLGFCATNVRHAIRKIDALIARNDPSVADLKEWVKP